MIEREENKSRVRFVERHENRHSERDKEENDLLVAIVEQTDVINLYGRGTVPHALYRSLMILFGVFDDNGTSTNDVNAIERRLDENLCTPVDCLNQMINCLRSQGR